jgi:hypothetical protein
MVRRNSPAAIKKKNATYVRNRSSRTRHGQHWTDQEDRTLISLWGSSQRKIEREFRTRSWRSICIRASTLNLPFGIPQGHESIAAAAKRTGVARHTLKRLYDRLSITIYRCMSQQSRTATSRFQYVDIDDTDSAVEWYLSLETLTFFARKYQIDRTGLRRRVEQAKLQPQFEGPRDVRYNVEDLESIYQTMRFTSDQISTVQLKAFREAWGHSPLQKIWEIVPRLSVGQIYRLALAQGISRPPEGFDRFSTFCLRAGIRSSFNTVRSMIVKHAPKHLWWRAPDLPWRFGSLRKNARPSDYQGSGWCKYIYVSTEALIRWMHSAIDIKEEKSA